MPFRILSISYDPSLLATRQQLLERRGYVVVSEEGFVKALQRCHEGGFDLVVMGHSIPQADKEELLKVVNRSCAAPVVSLVRVGEPPLRGAAASVDPMNPQAFMEAIGSLLDGNKRTSA